VRGTESGAGGAGGGGGGLARAQRRRSLWEGRTPGLAGNGDLAPTRVRGQWAGVPGGGRNGIRAAGDSALYRLRKNHWFCHPEEPQAVLSEAKEGSLQLLDLTTAEILRFTQNDSLAAFFRSLCTHTGRPLGRGEFLKKLERHRQRRLAPQKGHPRRPNSKTTQEEETLQS
jgi:hypothetical protein